MGSEMCIRDRLMRGFGRLLPLPLRLLSALGTGVSMLTAETLVCCVQGRAGVTALTDRGVPVVGGEGDFDSWLVVRRVDALMFGGLEKSGCGRGVSFEIEGLVWRGTSSDFEPEVERCWLGALYSIVLTLALMVRLGCVWPA